MISPAASAIAALLGGAPGPMPGTQTTGGAPVEPFASFLAAATLGGTIIDPSLSLAAPTAPDRPTRELLGLLQGDGAAGPTPFSLPAATAPVPGDDESAAVTELGPQPAPIPLPGAPAETPVATPALPNSVEPSLPTPPPGRSVPEAGRTGELPPELRSVPGITFLAEAAAPAPAPALPQPIAQPAQPSVPTVTPDAAVTPQPGAATLPATPSVASPPEQPVQQQTAGPHAPTPPIEQIDRADAARPVPPTLGTDPAPVSTPAHDGPRVAATGPAAMSSTIERIIQIVEQTTTTPRAMVVELPETEGARLLVSMRGEAVHVSVASQGSGLPGHGWLSELGNALATRGFVPEGLLADSREGRRSPYQNPDDPPPARSDSEPRRRSRRPGLTL